MREPLFKLDRQQPKMVLKDRIIALKDSNQKLVFIDVRREKIVARCEIEKVTNYQLLGEYLIIRTADSKFYKLALPFFENAK